MIIAVTGTRGFPGTQGGVEKHCEKLYPHLIKIGCEVVVFTRKAYTKIHTYQFKGVRLLPVRCPRNKYLEAFVHTFVCVIKAQSIHADVLHIHAIGPSLFAPLARLFGMRVVVTHHGPDYRRGKWPFPAKVFLRLCEWAGMTFANEIIAISDDIAGDIRRKFRREVCVLPNGVEKPGQTMRDDTLKQFNLKKMKYILAVGRFVPEKGFHDLIDAFVALTYNDMKLVIVGDADHEDAYSNAIKEKASEHRNIVLTGFLQEKPLSELYSFARLFVLPSYHEGMPIVLLEAMSYGASCIASDIPSNRMVLPGRDRFFNVGNPTSLYEKICEFLDRKWDDEDREKQSNRVMGKYNWQKIADDTYEVYKRATS